VNDRIIRWFLLLHKFDLIIIENPGKEKVAAYFLSMLSLLVGYEGMIDDKNLDECLFFISVLSPWFSNIDNYLVAARFPPNMSSREKCIIVRKISPFTWVGGNIFKLGPDQILRVCVREEGLFEILLACHNGPSGGN